MPKRKKKTEKISTQILLVASMPDYVKAELLATMQRLGVVRSEAYNKLGSVNYWGLDWRKAYPRVRAFRTPESLGLPSKLMEWTVSDVSKAINAQQAACIEALRSNIWHRYPGNENESKRKDCYKQLSSTEFLTDSFLHRIVRKQYRRGHSWVRNQIVYQQGGYTCKRIDRYIYQLELAGLQRGKRNRIIVRSNRKVKGQIRLIHNKDLDRFEIHMLVNYGTVSVPKELKTIGIDKGYTEAYYDSDGNIHGAGLGKLASRKSNRITAKNLNRGKLWALSRKYKTTDPAKSARILENNLTRKTENRRYRRDQAAITSLIGSASRSLFSGQVKVFAEDLTKPIKGKRQSKAMSRKLNAWMKGCMRDSLQKWANWTGSVITEVQPSYTSQVDSVTGTLLGARKGDNFIRFTGDVLQADLNAARNILVRGADKDITRFMRKEEVQAVLIRRTACFLKGLGLTLVEAVELGWLDFKHIKSKAFKKLASGS
ncbi:MAG: zinc ribbon domain-containing protein [Calothrix sp. MO_192.B10]|nr:zinc ribbon domain-containing protein [Calothrix sp. MO_192.B10]